MQLLLETIAIKNKCNGVCFSESQKDLQKFDMLPDIALDAGYSEFTELQPSTSKTVDDDGVMQIT